HGMVWASIRAEDERSSDGFLDIEIAFHKFDRQMLILCQLSYVAAKWLEAGNYSSPLMSLAYEFNPFDYSEVEVKEWIQAAKIELAIELDRAKEQTHSLSHKVPKGPSSALSQDFTEGAKQILERFGQLIMLRRYAYMGGGGGSWHLVTHFSEWAKLLDEGRPRTAYTIILENELSVLGKINSDFLDQTLKIFDKWGDLMIAKILDDDSMISLHPFEWKMTGHSHQDADESLQQARNRVVEFFDKHRGARVAVGRNIWIWEDEIYEKTAYYPDADGSVRTGAY
ncbi:MAG: hypothetical protein AAF902_26715, partial [Chloroflexota bacterium]